MLIALSHGGPRSLMDGVRGYGTWLFRPGVPVDVPEEAALQLLDRHTGRDPQYGAKLYLCDTGEPTVKGEDAAGTGSGETDLPGPHPPDGGEPASPSEVLDDKKKKSKGSTVTLDSLPDGAKAREG